MENGGKSLCPPLLFRIPWAFMYLCGQKGDFFLSMKQKKMLLFFCLISLLLTGCRHRPAMDFAAIEALLPSRPDSVVALLKPVNPERFVTADKAHYYLLLAEAEERQGKLPSSDKSILLAAQYFNAYRDDYRYARALYLQGRIYEEWRIYDKAVFCWVKALDYAEGKGDQGLLYRLSIHIGHRYAFQEDTDHALRCYQSALRYAEATADSAAIAFSHVAIGRLQEQRDHWFAANRAYSVACAIAEEVRAWDAWQEAMMGRIMVLNHWLVFDEAAVLVRQLQAMPSLRKDAAYHYVIGYSALMRKDSLQAEAHLRQVVRLPGDLRLKRNACEMMADLLKARGNNEGKNYAEWMRTYNALIRQSLVPTSFVPIISYAQEKENRTRQQSTRRAVGFGVLLFAVTMAGYSVWRRKRRLYRRQMERDRLHIQSLNLQMNRLVYERETLEAQVASLTRQLDLWETRSEKRETEREGLERQIEILQRRMQQAQRVLQRLLSPSEELLERMRSHALWRPLTTKEWLELYLLVNHQQQNFQDNLCINYPDLHETDVELCCLIRMGLDKNSEIATFCNITVYAVQKRKQRLKQRLNIEAQCAKAGELEEYIRMM